MTLALVERWLFSGAVCWSTTDELLDPSAIHIDEFVAVRCDSTGSIWVASDGATGNRGAGKFESGCWVGVNGSTVLIFGFMTDIP